MIQLIIEHLRDVGRIALNGSVEDFKEFASHFGNIYRVVKEVPLGVEHQWERNGPDHFVHTLIYALVGLDRYASSMAKIVEPNMFEGMPTGRIFDNSANMNNTWNLE